MLYMVQGYVFISTYSFIRFKKNELNHLFFKSVVSSYILKILFDWIFVHADSTTKIIRFFHVQYESFGYVVILLLFSVGLAWLSATITQSKRFNKLLLGIGIVRTTNPNIWEDIIDPGCWLMVYLNSRELVYLGQFKYGEEFVNKPLIVLEHYQIMNLDGEIIHDYSDDSNEVALIDTKNIERIEITYQR